MGRVSTLLLCAGIAAGLAAETHLKVGDTAPDFSLPATTGKQITLSEFRGNKGVVLAFFPAAFTGG